MYENVKDETKWKDAINEKLEKCNRKYWSKFFDKLLVKSGERIDMVELEAKINSCEIEFD